MRIAAFAYAIDVVLIVLGGIHFLVFLFNIVLVCVGGRGGGGLSSRHAWPDLSEHVQCETASQARGLGSRGHVGC